MWTQQRLPGWPTDWMGEWMNDSFSVPRRYSPKLCSVQFLFSLTLLLLVLQPWPSAVPHSLCPHHPLSASFTRELREPGLKHQPLLPLPLHLSGVSCLLLPVTLTYTNRETRIPKSLVREGSVQQDYGNCRGPLYLPKATENWVLFLTSNLLFLPTYQVSKKKREKMGCQSLVSILTSCVTLGKLYGFPKPELANKMGDEAVFSLPLQVLQAAGLT